MTRADIPFPHAFTSLADLSPGRRASIQRKGVAARTASLAAFAEAVMPVILAYL